MEGWRVDVEHESGVEGKYGRMEGWGVDVEHESGVEVKDGRVGSRRRE